MINLKGIVLRSKFDLEKFMNIFFNFHEARLPCRILDVKMCTAVTIGILRYEND